MKLRLVQATPRTLELCRLNRPQVEATSSLTIQTSQEMLEMTNVISSLSYYTNFCFIFLWLCSTAALTTCKLYLTHFLCSTPAFTIYSRLVSLSPECFLLHLCCPISLFRWLTSPPGQLLCISSNEKSMTDWLTGSCPWSGGERRRCLVTLSPAGKLH